MGNILKKKKTIQFVYIHYWTCIYKKESLLLYYMKHIFRTWIYGTNNARVYKFDKLMIQIVSYEIIIDMMHDIIFIFLSYE